MSFVDGLKSFFKFLGKPFVDFFKSPEGNQYKTSAKALLGTAEGQVVLAFVQDLNNVPDLASPAKRDIVLVKAAAQFAAIGIQLATSEIALLIETAVNYIKGHFGTQDVVVGDKVKAVAAQALQDVKK